MKKLWLAAVFSVLGFSSNAIATQYNFTTIDFPGATDTFANGINDQVSIVGSYTNNNNLINRTENGDHGFLYEGGVFTTIDFPSADATELNDINNSGTMVGTSSKVNRIPFGTGFSFDGNNFSTIQFPDAVDFGTSLNGISNSGVMVGTYDHEGGFNINFTVDGNTITKLPDIFGDDSHANDINNQGLIVGTLTTPAPADVISGFIFENGTLTTFLFPGSDATTASGINDFNNIVGSFSEAGGGFELQHGYLFDNGNFQQIDFPGATATEARGINNSGQIVGTYFNGSNWHGFLASKTTQVPEPATALLIGLTLGGLVFMRRNLLK